MSEQSPPKASQRSGSRKKSSASKKIRLERLVVRNLKALDQLEIDLPAPEMAADPDIFVLGSKNGLGKTSFLEACFIVFLATLASRGMSSFHLDLDIREYIKPLIDLPDMLVRAGARQAELEGTFSIGNKTTARLNIVFERNGKVAIEGNTTAFARFVPSAEQNTAYIRDAISRFAHLLAGLNSDALVLPPYAYFHSYRKVQEGNFELNYLLENNRHRLNTRPYPPPSTFKREIIQLLMGRGNIIEDLNHTEAETMLHQLKTLMQRYAGGHIEKLRISDEGTVGFPIIPVNGGPSFAFDSLSSGQKEIISTLFLIWRSTKSQPGIILIDEPELHLNAEWHHSFVNSLYELAPENQYLLATHSEDIAASVEKERRILFQ